MSDKELLPELKACPENIVDRARGILLAAISNANKEGTEHLARLYRKVRDRDAAQMDTWLALDAVIDALSQQPGVREQGQAEGFAAAIACLRGLSAQKPPHSLYHAASVLADSLEQSQRAAKDQDHVG